MSNRKSIHLLILSFLFLSSGWVEAREKKVKIQFLGEPQLGNRRVELMTKLRKEVLDVTRVSGQVEFLPISNHIQEEADLLLVVAWAPFDILRMELQGKSAIVAGGGHQYIKTLPLDSLGGSGVDDFSYVTGYYNHIYEISLFHEMKPFKKLLLLNDLSSGTSFNGDEELRDLAKKLQFEIVFQDIPKDASRFDIPEDIDAVYAYFGLGSDDELMKRVAYELKNRKLPSFSNLHRGVELGLMASYSDRQMIVRYMRKVALMIEDFLSGTPLKKLPAQVNLSRQLYFNRSTLESIGFYPKFEYLFQSSLINDNPENGDPWDIERVVRTFLEKNLQLKINSLDVERSRLDKKEAVSLMFPKINSSLTGVQIDQEHAETPGRVERVVMGNIDVEQIIFSERAWSGIRIYDFLLKAQSEAERKELYNEMYDLYSAYFQVLKARTLAKIRGQQLDVSKENLEIAKTKNQIGQSSKADVFRFESQVANDLQAMIEAQLSWEQASVYLAQLLQIPHGHEFYIEGGTLDEEAFRIFNPELLGALFDSPNQLDIFSDFLINYAFDQAPTLKELQYRQKVASQTLVSNKRTYYAPTIAGSFGYERVLHRGGIKTPAPGSEFLDNSWTAAVNMSYPIFSGGERSITVKKNKIDLKKLKLQKNNIKQKIAVNIRHNIMALVKARTALRFGKISEINAQKAFELVRDAYRKGQASIIQLLDAQTNMVNSQLNHQNSTYDYILSFLNVEYSIGRFHQLSTAKENEEFKNQAVKYLSSRLANEN